MNAIRDILVIDDEPVVTQGVSRICAAEGMSVDVAESGSAGLQMLGRNSYRLIVCDLMMTDIDGLDFLAEVARRQVSSPVVMTTGYSTVENAAKSLSCGAIDFIAKPFTAEELLAVVQRAFSYGRLQEAIPAADAAGTPATFPYVPPPANYYRLGHISWALPEPPGTVLIGVHDLFVKTIAGVRKVELQPVGGDLAQGNNCATITDADALVHGVICPVSGRILARNETVVSGGDLIEKAPYSVGWLYRVLPVDLECNLHCLTLCGRDRT